ncbi:MAG TPA: hypothetical protein VKA44_05735 [Gemmatimonadota bacterium]|nr:hypothetical protein [Gemmatimonadota bacterium]
MYAHIQQNECARRARALVAAATAAALLSACSAWRPLETPYRKALSDRHPLRARITRDDSAVVSLYRPTVAADSVVGFTDREDPGSRTAIPLARVTDVETQHAKPLATVGVVALVLASLVAVLALAVDLGDVTIGDLGS